MKKIRWSMWTVAAVIILPLSIVVRLLPLSMGDILLAAAAGGVVGAFGVAKTLS